MKVEAVNLRFHGLCVSEILLVELQNMAFSYQFWFEDAWLFQGRVLR